MPPGRDINFIQELLTISMLETYYLNFIAIARYIDYKLLYDCYLASRPPSFMAAMSGKLRLDGLEVWRLLGLRAFYDV